MLSVILPNRRLGLKWVIFLTSKASRSPKGSKSYSNKFQILESLAYTFTADSTGLSFIYMFEVGSIKRIFSRIESAYRPFKVIQGR